MASCLCSQCKIIVPDIEPRVPCLNCGGKTRIFDLEVCESAHAIDTVTVGVVRGDASWAYFYMSGGLALAFFWTFTEKLDGLKGSIVQLCGTVLIAVSFLMSGKLHNTLLRFKMWYEGKER